MNYEQKYNEALERAKRLHGEPTGGTERIVCEQIFPELRETEDERNRKEIIDFLKLPHPQFVGKRDHENWIAWLEKQGEQPTDKKVGDWVVQENIGTYKIIEVCESWYEVIDNQNNHYSIGFDKEDMCHLWTIQDAKDGDVLVAKDGHPFIFTGEFDAQDGNPIAYCGINSDNKFITGKGSHWTFKDGITPATKEQRDLLFHKMKEAEYDWDAEKIKLKKIESKKLDADEVVKWMNHRELSYDDVVTTVIPDSSPTSVPHRVKWLSDEFIKQFKKDFGL